MTAYKYWRRAFLGLGRRVEVLSDSAKESLLFSGIGVLVAFPVFWVFGLSYPDSFGFVLLIEACGLMLVGGVMEFTSTGVIRRFLSLTNSKLSMDPGAMRKQMKGAVLYTLIGVILFLESLLVAVLLSI